MKELNKQCDRTTRRVDSGSIQPLSAAQLIQHFITVAIRRGKFQRWRWPIAIEPTWPYEYTTALRGNPRPAGEKPVTRSQTPLGVEPGIDWVEPRRETPGFGATTDAGIEDAH